MHWKDFARNLERVRTSGLSLGDGFHLIRLTQILGSRGKQRWGWHGDHRHRSARVHWDISLFLLAQTLYTSLYRTPPPPHACFEWYSVMKTARLEKLLHLHTCGGAPYKSFIVVKRKLRDNFNFVC